MPDSRLKALSLHGPWPTPRMIAPGMSLKIGRHPTSDIIFEGGSVSRSHAVIRWPEGDGPVIEDLGSTNGTSLDGHFLVEGAEPLHVGSTIIVGDFTIRVSANDGRGPPTTRALRVKEQGVGHVTFGSKSSATNVLEDTEPGRPARAK
jgi:pSer/pThr/pTyr-binding forkhead associated (FHA) protein